MQGPVAVKGFEEEGPVAVEGHEEKGPVAVEVLNEEANLVRPVAMERQLLNEGHLVLPVC